MNISTTPRQPWAKAIRDPGDEYYAHEAWQFAEQWLTNFGGSLGTEPSNAWAKLDTNRFAFRLDSGTKHMVIIVHIDYDADGNSEGYRDCSQATLVEIHRG